MGLALTVEAGEKIFIGLMELTVVSYPAKNTCIFEFDSREHKVTYDQGVEILPDVYVILGKMHHRLVFDAPKHISISRKDPKK